MIFVLLFIRKSDYATAAVVKAQQQPQASWSLTGVTFEEFLQSKLVGADTLTLP